MINAVAVETPRNNPITEAESPVLRENSTPAVRAERSVEESGNTRESVAFQQADEPTSTAQTEPALAVTSTRASMEAPARDFTSTNNTSGTASTYAAESENAIQAAPMQEVEMIAATNTTPEAASEMEMAEVSVTKSTPELVEDVTTVDAATESVTPVASSEAAAPIITRPRYVNAGWRVGAEAGIMGSELTSSMLGMNLYGFAGVVVDYQWSEHWALMSGLGWSHRSSYGSEQTYDQTSYGFGVRQEHIEVQAHSADFLELPVILAYVFGNSRVEVGGYVAYLVGDNSRVTRTVTTSLENTRTESYMARGYDNGNANWDAGLRLGYAYSLGDHWQITASGLMGLTDAFEAPVESSVNRHVQLRVGARYLIEP